MGQTLTHGVYLPDEGERNCYNGLASNWSILDGAVGTIAEHTSALAGKAPAVHTHGKADITDLFNSVNTWTQTSYFTKDITINSEIAANAQSALSGSKIKQIVFNDSNNSNYFFRFRQYVDATSSRMQFNAQGFDSNNQAYSATFVYRVNPDGSSVLYPGDNNQSLGTSTNKWKSLNGVNPGALSLPKEEYSDVDISAQGLNWDLTGSSDNSYTPNRDGWLEIWVKRTSLPTAYISVGNAYVRQVSEATVFNFACVTCPVRNGQTYTVRILANECHVRIMKAEGNV